MTSYGHKHVVFYLPHWPTLRSQIW